MILEAKIDMTKCWEFKLKLEKKTIKTFVYSDTGKDIEARFPNNKVTNIKKIDDHTISQCVADAIIKDMERTQGRELSEDDKIRIVYQKDFEPGLAVRGDEDMVDNNEIICVKAPINLTKTQQSRIETKSSNTSVKKPAFNHS